MKTAALLLYCSPQRIIQNGIIETDAQGIVLRIGSLSQYDNEPHSTTFLNGILLPFAPDTEQIIQEGLKKALEREFEASQAEIKEGKCLSLWLLSGDNLFQKEIQPPLSVTRLL